MEVKRIREWEFVRGPKDGDTAMLPEDVQEVCVEVGPGAKLQVAPGQDLMSVALLAAQRMKARQEQPGMRTVIYVRCRHHDGRCGHLMFLEEREVQGCR